MTDIQAASKIKIMIIDDSLVIRSVLKKIIGTDPNIEIVGIYPSAERLLTALDNIVVDILLLDIEMPGMTGIEAIPHILKKNQNIKIFMVSTLTSKNAPIAIEALTLGAVDYIEKPDSTTIANGSSFQDNLIAKIKNIAKKNCDNYLTKPLSNNTHHLNSDLKDTNTYRLLSSNIVLRHDRPFNFKPQIFAIAASTGGPKAISDLLLSFGAHYLADKIIIITQHMPALFTKLFAENLDKLGIIKCQEAEQDTILNPGNLYIAPGNKHMKITLNKAKQPSITLDDGPPINFCKPSADPMIESAAEIFKNEMLTIILTGMGKDALEGTKAAVKHGSSVIAQDENSSIVWGMPGNVAVNNLCSAVLPLNNIAHFIIRKGSI
jgi:two-component system chemotaxis response regulator CheB